MADDRRMTTDRFFGGVDGRLENLRSMLEYVASVEPDESDLWEWLRANTVAESESTISAYVGFQRSIELLVLRDGRYRTTSRGAAYANTGDPELVADALFEHVKGFETILQAIERGQRTRDAIQTELRAVYPDYKLPMAVVGRHLEWLEAVGALEVHDEQFILTALGQRLVDDLEDDRWVSAAVERDSDREADRDQSSGQDLESLRERAQEAATETASKSTREREVVDYDRSEAIREYVLERADGVCEGCREPAPFRNRSGDPYLQSHHVHELSTGGSDSPDTVIALCPNCHYRVHHGVDGDAYNRELEYWVGELEQGSRGETS